MELSLPEPIETQKKNGGWTPKKVIMTVAGILALLGASGGGVYGINQANTSETSKAQMIIDREQSREIKRNSRTIEKIYDKVIENGKGIERLLERTK